MPMPAFNPLRTERLSIRVVSPADLPDLLQVNGDDEVTRFLPYATWQSMDDARAWLARMQAMMDAGTGHQLVLERTADAKMIGSALLFKHDEPSRRVELGYVLARAAWGQGLMHEATRALCAQAFGAMSIRRIEAEVNPANAASCKLLERLGFKLEGTLRQRWHAKGVVYDTCLYGCLQSEWR
jgi:[ribosomal protein S5]-alanine N-acetyltransferase